MDVTLEPLSREHLDGAAELWGDPRVIRYTAVPAPCDRQAAAARLEALLERQTDPPLLFAVLEAGRFCGVAGCLPAEEGTFGLFYQLLPAVWGRGVGTRAAELALARLEESHPGAGVVADAVAANAASARILERLGFARRAVRPGAFTRDGETADVWAYARRPGGEKEERT